LAGIILFYRGVTLQGKQLENQKAQSEAKRLSDMVYRQLEFFNNRFQELRFEYPVERPLGSSPTLPGYHAMDLLTKELDQEINTYQKTSLPGDNAILNDRQSEYFLGILQNNKDQFMALYEALEASCNVLRSAFDKSNLGGEECGELKSIFFLNVGVYTMSVCERLSLILESKLGLKRHPEARISFFDPMVMIHMKITSVLDFYRGTKM
jgi:hypothetical protein